MADEELKDMIGHDENGKHLVVFSLAVRPEFRGLGVSKQLVATFVKRARALGKQKIMLLCKINLIAYYQRRGFDHAGRSASTHGGFQWHEMVMRL